MAKPASDDPSTIADDLQELLKRAPLHEAIPLRIALQSIANVGNPPDVWGDADYVGRLVASREKAPDATHQAVLDYLLADTGADVDEPYAPPEVLAAEKALMDAIITAAKAPPLENATARRAKGAGKAAEAPPS
jgi:hypothetical protein